MPSQRGLQGRRTYTRLKANGENREAMHDTHPAPCLWREGKGMYEDRGSSASGVSHVCLSAGEGLLKGAKTGLMRNGAGKPKAGRKETHSAQSAGEAVTRFCARVASATELCLLTQL